MKPLTLMKAMILIRLLMVPCLRMLLPVLIDFFQKHPLIAPKTFLGDAAFDTIEIYKALFGEIGFEKASRYS